MSRYSGAQGKGAERARKAAGGRIEAHRQEARERAAEAEKRIREVESALEWCDWAEADSLLRDPEVAAAYDARLAEKARKVIG